MQVAQYLALILKIWLFLSVLSISQPIQLCNRISATDDMKDRHALGKKDLKYAFLSYFLSLVFAEEHRKGKITYFLSIIQRTLHESS